MPGSTTKVAEWRRVAALAVQPRTLPGLLSTHALLSKGAATHLRGSTSAAIGAFDLGPETYYGRRSIVRISSRARDGRPKGKVRVGIDRRSFDHESLTRLEFPDEEGYSYVDCDFPSMPAAILDDLFDVGLWHRLALIVPLRLLDLKVDTGLRPATELFLASLANAQVLWPEERLELRTLFDFVDLSTVRRCVEDLAALDPDSEELRSRLWLV